MTDTDWSSHQGRKDFWIQRFARDFEQQAMGLLLPYFSADGWSSVERAATGAAARTMRRSLDRSAGIDYLIDTPTGLVGLAARVGTIYKPPHVSISRAEVRQLTAAQRSGVLAFGWLAKACIVDGVLRWLTLARATDVLDRLRLSREDGGWSVDSDGTRAYAILGPRAFSAVWGQGGRRIR